MKKLELLAVLGIITGFMMTGVTLALFVLKYGPLPASEISSVPLSYPILIATGLSLSFTLTLLSNYKQNNKEVKS